MRPYCTLLPSNKDRTTLYDLVGLVSHSGGMSFGHYIAIVKGLPCLEREKMKKEEKDHNAKEEMYVGEKEVPLLIALQCELRRSLGVNQTNGGHARRDVCTLQGVYAHKDERRKNNRHQPNRNQVRTHLEDRPEQRGQARCSGWKRVGARVSGLG